MRRRKTTPKTRPSLLIPGLLLVLLMSLLVVFANRNFSLYAVMGASMEPTFRNGQSIVLQKVEKPKPALIIIFHKPAEWTHFAGENDLLIKRLYGLPGDTVTLSGNNILVNGKVVSILPADYECMVPSFTHKLSSKEYFVMGDNPLRSLDSRRMLCDGKKEQSFLDKEVIVGYGNVVAQF